MKCRTSERDAKRGLQLQMELCAFYNVPFVFGASPPPSDSSRVGPNRSLVRLAIGRFLLHFFLPFGTISCYCSFSSSSLLSPSSLALTEHIRHLWILNATHYAYDVLVHIASIVRIRNDCSGLLRFHDYHIVITINVLLNWMKCSYEYEPMANVPWARWKPFNMN